MRLERRPRSSRAALAIAPVGAVLFTMAVSALLVLWAGAPVGRTYALLLSGGFGSVFAWSETLTRAIPLILTGLSATVAFKARLFNIGAEGQLYAGALAAIAVGGMHGGAGFEWPVWLLFPLMMLAAALAGALLLLGPALMKNKLGVDEVVTTLLFNFIVLLGVGALLDGAMKDPTAMGWPQSVALQSDLELAKLMVGAVGIVFGDIGTSPIYAFRETFAGHHELLPTTLHIYGVLSLIFWSMLIIVALKYVTIIMRADNKGEGGSLALLALINRTAAEGEKKKWTMGIVMLGVFGQAAGSLPEKS